jgi:hypothetical protein
MMSEDGLGTHAFLRPPKRVDEQTMLDFASARLICIKGGVSNHSDSEVAIGG